MYFKYFGKKNWNIKKRFDKLTLTLLWRRSETKVDFFCDAQMMIRTETPRSISLASCAMMTGSEKVYIETTTSFSAASSKRITRTSGSSRRDSGIGVPPLRRKSSAARTASGDEGVTGVWTLNELHFPGDFEKSWLSLVGLSLSPVTSVATGDFATEYGDRMRLQRELHWRNKFWILKRRDDT